MLNAEELATIMMMQQETNVASPINIDEIPEHTLERIFGKYVTKYIQCKTTKPIRAEAKKTICLNPIVVATPSA